MGVKVHKTKGFLLKTGLLLVLFILFSPRAHSSDRAAKLACLAKLQHPSHEIYVASLSISHVLPDRQRHTVNSRSARSRKDLLLEGPLKDKYQKILQTASANPHLYRLTLFVLSEIEHLPQRPSNHSEWVSFLYSSNVEDLNHRIYEGFHAISLLNTKLLHIAFEPKVGFFSDGQTRKSMDLEVRDTDNGKVLAYKEIKRVYKHSSTSGVIKSIIGKTNEIRPKVGEETELSGVVYIGSPRDISSDPINKSEIFNEFERAKANARLSLTRRIEDGYPHGLDSLLLIDLELEQYAKFYIQGNDVIMTEGDYPLESVFRFLSFNVN